MYLCLFIAIICRHEDGSVRFWDVSSVNLRLIYKLSTSTIFGIETTSPTEQPKVADGDDEWPPFRKVAYYLCIEITSLLERMNCTSCGLDRGTPSVEVLALHVGRIMSVGFAAAKWRVSSSEQVINLTQLVVVAISRS
jgi:hypothetical protein